MFMVPAVDRVVLSLAGGPPGSRPDSPPPAVERLTSFDDRRWQGFPAATTRCLDDTAAECAPGAGAWVPPGRVSRVIPACVNETSVFDDAQGISYMALT